jgi:hypothetical protein
MNPRDCKRPGGCPDFSRCTKDVCDWLWVDREDDPKGSLMKITVELTDAEVVMLTTGFVEYVHAGIDAVCSDDDAKSWRSDMDLAKSISDKFVAATGAPAA